MDTESAALGRQLSARRRGGSSWGSSSSSRGGWSPRRRSPPAPPTSPRRRAPSAPSVWSPRRRAPVSPRRRDVRRRAPPPPVPAPVNTRRRTTSINGQTYSASPRRRFGTTGVPSPPAVPYGYANRPQLMNNYGGVLVELAIFSTLRTVFLLEMLVRRETCSRHDAVSDSLWLFWLQCCASTVTTECCHVRCWWCSGGCWSNVCVQ